MNRPPLPLPPPLQVPGHNLLQMSSAVQDWVVAADEAQQAAAAAAAGSSGKRRGRKAAAAAAAAEPAAEEAEEAAQAGDAGSVVAPAASVELDEDALATDADDISNMGGVFGTAELPEDYQL